MKIGLVRHFKIAAPINKTFLNSREFAIWVKKYELSGVRKNDQVQANVLTDWPRCICSSVTRTVETANLLYGQNVDKTELIRDVPLAPVLETRMRLPLLFWILSGRAAWLLSHQSQPESVSETVKRVKNFVSKLLSSDTDVLVITHGFIMRLICNELFKAGFKGRSFIKPKNGELYVYEY